jgi:fatty-acyl-CoA synthase
VAAAVSRPDPHAGEVPVVYVQLQEKADLTPEQILEYLKKEIGERAAIPKEVLIIKDMPLTPVGKIFKPVLRRDAIRRVYQTELEALRMMVQSVEVKVTEDRLHGTLAILMIRPNPQASRESIEARVKELLARYPVRYQIEIK